MVRADSPAPLQGKRVEYVVTEIRGAIAHYERVEDPVRKSKTVAVSLAARLGVEAAELLGCRFTCWVEPAEFGVFMRDFRLERHGDSP